MLCSEHLINYHYFLTYLAYYALSGTLFALIFRMKNTRVIIKEGNPQ